MIYSRGHIHTRTHMHTLIYNQNLCTNTINYNAIKTAVKPLHTRQTTIPTFQKNTFAPTLS